MTFDPSKPARTKSGLPARFLGKLDNSLTAYPLLFAVGGSGKEVDCRYGLNGEYVFSADLNNHMDLENIPVKHTREFEILLYDNGTITIQSQNAKFSGLPPNKLIACKRITVEFEEGEGL